MPTETVNGLTPPLPGFPFFANADRFPFEPTASECPSVNAWWLADASFLVYGDGDFIEDALRETPLPDLGYEIEWLGERDDNRGMALINEESMIVIFRGTRLEQHKLLGESEAILMNQNDFKTNSRFLPTALDAGGKVHRGFLSAFAEVSDDLDEIVSTKTPDQSLWLTGHSLGGALAVIAAAHIELFHVQGICTFGCPRVGNEAFANALPNEQHARYTFRDDWVPSLPPEITGYRHGGDQRDVPGCEPRKFLDDFSRGSKTVWAVAKSVAKELKVDLGELPMKIGGLADHAPIYYASLLWNDFLKQQSQ